MKGLICESCSGPFRATHTFVRNESTSTMVQHETAGLAWYARTEPYQGFEICILCYCECGGVTGLTLNGMTLMPMDGIPNEMLEQMGASIPNPDKPVTGLNLNMTAEELIALLKNGIGQPVEPPGSDKVCDEVTLFLESAEEDPSLRERARRLKQALADAAIEFSKKESGENRIEFKLTPLSTEQLTEYMGRIEDPLGLRGPDEAA